jgi:hypothetical protein
MLRQQQRNCSARPAGAYRPPGARRQKALLAYSCKVRRCTDPSGTPCGGKSGAATPTRQPTGHRRQYDLSAVMSPPPKPCLGCVLSCVLWLAEFYLGCFVFKACPLLFSENITNNQSINIGRNPRHDLKSESVHKWEEDREVDALNLRGRVDRFVK